MVQLDVLCIGYLVRDGDGGVAEAHSTSTLVRADGRCIVVDTSTEYMWPAVKTSFRQIGVFPEDVDTVVLTHSHSDHCGNLRRYRRARILVHAGGADVPGAEVWDGDAMDLCPGVRAVHVPGHCPEECAVLVEADRRYAIAGDAVPLEDNIREGKPPGICSDRGLALGSMERIRAYADVVVPGHGAPFVV